MKLPILKAIEKAITLAQQDTLVMIEAQVSESIGENDIMRLEDDFKRIVT